MRKHVYIVMPNEAKGVLKNCFIFIDADIRFVIINLSMIARSSRK